MIKKDVVKGSDGREVMEIDRSNVSVEFILFENLDIKTAVLCKSNIHYTSKISSK